MTYETLTQPEPDAETSSIGTTQALEEGLSVATSKFNTERFGALSVPPGSATSTTNLGNGTATATTSLGTERGTHIMAHRSDLQDDIDELDHNEHFDDDLDFTELGEVDFGGEDILMDNNDDKGNLELSEGDETATVAEGRPKARRMIVEEDSQQSIENEILRQKVAEMAEIIKARDTELMTKSGEVSILRMNLDTHKKETRMLDEELRSVRQRHEVEKLEMEKKSQVALENAQVAYQFDVNVKDDYGRPEERKNAANVKTTGASFPIQPFCIQPFCLRVVVSFTPLNPSGVQYLPVVHEDKIKEWYDANGDVVNFVRNLDDNFSLENFAMSQKPMSRSRSVGPRAASFEKPKPVVQITESVRTSRPVFGFNSEMPTRSPEEVIRDNLLAARDTDYGLPQLCAIEPDEERCVPLKGSRRFNENMQLGLITQQCYRSVTDLVRSVNPGSKDRALRDTTRLLQASLILDKPLHATNTLRVLRILIMTYEDLSDEVSGGSVPFLEHDNEDVWSVVPSETSLPSALACVVYLLLTRLVRDPPTKEGLSRTGYKLKQEAEDVLQIEIFQVLNYLAWSQKETKQLARMFVPLIRKGVFPDLIRFHAAKNNLRNVGLSLDILDIATRDEECRKLLMGWRMSQMAWGDSFPLMNILIGLLGLKAESMEELANGPLPRIKIRVLDIISRSIFVNFDQTKKILGETKLIYTLVYSIRDLEEVAAAIKHRRDLVSLHQPHGAGTPFTTSIWKSRTHTLLEKPLLMTSVRGRGGTMIPTGAEKGVSPLASVPLNANDKIFDYLVVLKLELELVVNLFRAVSDEMKALFTKRANEMRAIAFAVAKISARDLGLAVEARELASEVLFEVVPDDEMEQAYLNLVKDD
ncbi:hypothetical protein BGX29_000957 [Mortierella sp. GBA35]|nr:hypothetical protein BGX29_000957 [Mortierella sp. GBA35]